MEVILQQDYPSLGFVGDRVTVKSGYARNWLIPKGIAVEVSSQKARVINHLMQGVLAKKSRLKSEAEGLGETLKGHTLQFKLAIGEHGKSFGSITSRDIQGAFDKLGYTLDRKQIKLHEPLKQVGSFTVAVQLHSEVSVEVPIEIEAKAQPVKKKASTKKGKKGDAPEGEDAQMAKDSEDEVPESVGDATDSLDEATELTDTEQEPTSEDKTEE